MPNMVLGWIASRRSLIVAAVVSAAGFTAVQAQGVSGKSIVVASTTSTRDSGLFAHILPLFKQKTGISVKVIAVGTGHALDTARRGGADVVFTHAKSAEEKFLSEGQGVKRYPVMYNDFVLVGPKSDPAGIKGMKDITAALKEIMTKNASFISRGTVPAPTSPKSIFGRRLASISITKGGLGTKKLVKAWVRRSIMRRPLRPMCCPTAVLGFRLEAKTTL